jgi:hypothetical protein
MMGDYFTDIEVENHFGKGLHKVAQIILTMEDDFHKRGGARPFIQPLK